MKTASLVALCASVITIAAITGCSSHKQSPKPLSCQTKQLESPPSLLAVHADPRGCWNRHHRDKQSEALQRYWLYNMAVWHGYTHEEIAAATRIPCDEVPYWLKRCGIPTDYEPKRPDNARIHIAPYPGGRHPRLGFFDGAIKPQRDTKVSIFTPWDQHSYVVYDLPEAVWSNLGLTYLAHTHLATIWDDQAIKLKRVEWHRHDNGSLSMERKLPNGISFGTEVTPGQRIVHVNMWLRNGTDETLTNLNIQNCLMLSRAEGFNQLSNDNKHHAKPYVACKSPDGDRWIITGFTDCHRTWANADVPCVHSDPKFPDCEPGETVKVRGIVAFYEGSDIETELMRLDATGWRGDDLTQAKNVPVETWPSYRRPTRYTSARFGFNLEYLPKLYDELNDRSQASRWGTITREIAYVGHRRDLGGIPAQQLIDFIQRRDDWAGYSDDQLRQLIQDKGSAISLLGFLEGDQTDQVLRTLATDAGAKALAETWDKAHLPAHWLEAEKRDDGIASLILARAALGLVHTQKPENLQLADEVFEQAKAKEEATGKRTQLYSFTLEAVAVRGMVADRGFDGYLEIIGKPDDLFAAAVPHIEKHMVSFDKSAK